MAPPTVIPNAIVELLLGGLAEIGAVPADWNTEPPPAKEGAPGDSIEDLPHQLFLEHVNTETRVGDGESIPANELQRRMNFTLWKFARDTGSGLSEVRNLEDDALRALLAVEPELEELTGFGFGPITTTPRPDMVRAGFKTSGLDFSCDFVFSREPVAAEADLSDLHELMRVSPFWIANGDAEWEAWLDTTVSAGGFIKLRGSHFQLDTGTGANRCYWRKREPERTLYPHDDYNIDGNGQEQTFRMAHIISAWICPTTMTNATPTSFIGIGLGAPENNPAFPFGEDGGANPCIQLRCRLDTLAWELVVFRGDTATYTAVALAGVEPAIRAKGSHIRLDWDPVTLRAAAYVDGVLGAEITDSNLLPEPDTLNPVQAHIAGNYFISSGSHASGRTLAQIGPILVTRPRARTDGLAPSMNN